MSVLAADCTVDHFIVLRRASPAGQVFAVEFRFEAVHMTVGENCVGFFRGDFPNRNVTPADLPAVSLQADRALHEQWCRTIEVVFHDRIVNDEFAVQPHAGAGSDLTDFETVPFAERFVSEFSRIFARGTWAVVPEPAAAFVGPNPEFLFVSVVPDLDLWIGFQIDAAVGLCHGLVVDHQLIIGELFIRRQIRTIAVIDEFFILDGPVLLRVGRPFGNLFVSGIGRHFRQFTGIVMRHPVPAGQIDTVEQRTKSFRDFSCRCC